MLIALAVMGLAGDPASEQFEGWTPQKSELSAGEVRVVGPNSIEPQKEGEETISYYVLDDPPQITFLTGGPATLMLKVRGNKEKLVTIRLDLDATYMQERSVRIAPERASEFLLRIPDGTHMVAISASSKIMLAPAQAGQTAHKVEDFVVWDEHASADSSFWRYKPNLSNFEHKEKEPPRRWSFWVNAGVGPSVDMDSSTSGLGIGGSVNLKIDYYLLQVRSTYSMELSVAGPEPQESIWEVSPMFGFVLKGRVGWISAGAGVGIVGGINRGKLIEHGQEPSDPDIYEETSFLTVGIPVDVQFFLKPPSFNMFGLGLNFFANVGPETSLVGLMLSIMAGI
ncbi:hypothetical protein ACFL2F_01850 [Myxococcota bacterium]